MGKKILIGRRRRKHSEEFKRVAVNLAIHEGLSVKEAATNLDIHPSLLQQWRAFVVPFTGAMRWF